MKEKQDFTGKIEEQRERQSRLRRKQAQKQRSVTKHDMMGSHRSLCMAEISSSYDELVRYEVGYGV